MEDQEGPFYVPSPWIHYDAVLQDAPTKSVKINELLNDLKVAQY